MSLREKIHEALVWGVGFRVFRDALQFGLMLVLVRRLDPSDYGLWGLQGSVIGFLGLASAKNFIAHIVQVRSDDEVHEQDHFTAGMVIQTAMFAVTNLVAVGLRFSDTYRSITPLLHVVSLGFMIELLGELRARLLERRLEFKRQRLLMAGGLVLTSILALVLAMSGAGVYALIVPPLLASLPFAWDSISRGRFRPSWQFNLERYRATVRFALARIGSGGLNGIRDLAQNGLIVHFFSFSTLGIYGRAVALGNLICANLASQFMSNLYPILTRYEDGSADYRRAAGLLLRGVTWLVAPIAAILALLAAPVVHTVYGTKWDAVIPLLPVAMVENFVRTLAYILYTLLLAAQRHRHCFHQDVVMLVLVAGALAVGLPAGPQYYLLLLASATAVGGTIMLWRLLKEKLLEASAVAVAFGPAAGGVVVAYVALGCTAAAFGLNPSGLIDAITLGGVFLATYIAVVRIGFALYLEELVRYLPSGDLMARLLGFPAPVVLPGTESV